MRARHWFLCAFHISNWDLVRLQNIYIFHNQQVRVLTDWMSRDSQLFFNFQKMSQCLLFSYYHRHHRHLLIYILGKRSNVTHLQAEATMCYHVIMEKNDSIHMIPSGITKICLKPRKSTVLEFSAAEINTTLIWNMCDFWKNHFTNSKTCYSRPPSTMIKHCSRER